MSPEAQHLLNLYQHRKQLPNKTLKQANEVARLFDDITLYMVLHEEAAVELILAGDVSILDMTPFLNTPYEHTKPYLDRLLNQLNRNSDKLSERDRLYLSALLKTPTE
jgi:hypothetical protein